MIHSIVHSEWVDKPTLSLYFIWKRGVFMAIGSKVSPLVYDMALPIAESEGCTVYDVEYKKEGSEFVMRVILDTFDDTKPVSITMCENVSRALSDALDKNDPTNTAYMLEVTSPGLDRPLKKEEDFIRFEGRDVEVGLYKALNGSKIITGTLVGLKDNCVVINDGKEDICVNREETSFVRLAVIF